MEHWELVARESIRDLVARYNASGDAGRFDEMLALFAPDAVVELPDRVCEGRHAIRACFEQVATRTGATSDASARLVRHFTGTLQIDVLGPSEARGRAYYLVLTDRGLDHWGRYVDAYRLVDGSWRFARRRIHLDAARPGGWGADAAEGGGAPELA